MTWKPGYLESWQERRWTRLLAKHLMDVSNFKLEDSIPYGPADFQSNQNVWSS